MQLRELSGKAAIYGLGTVFLKGINFFLLPLYTRHLSPEEYGILAVTLTLTTVLGLLFPLGLHGCLTKEHFSSLDQEERRRRLGNLALAILSSSGSLALILILAGPRFWTSLLKDVPYDPFIPLSVGTAFMNVLGLLPGTLLQVQERSKGYVSLTWTGALLNVGAVLYFVVLRGKGAYGYMLGTFLASAVMAVPHGAILWANSRLSLRWSILRPAFAYGLPLLPHGLAAWALTLSDRLILERFVPLSQVGLYLLAYQIASVVTILAQAINTAWVPFMFKTELEQPGTAPALFARLITFIVVVLVWAAMGIALLSKGILLLLASPRFHAASPLVPWMALGSLLGGLYLIPSNFLFLKSRTTWIPVGTLIAGAASIGLNLIVVPKFGTSGAAQVFVGSNLILFLLTSAVARRAYPVPYEYRRLAHGVVLGAIATVAGFTLPIASEPGLHAARAMIWLLFPVLLLATGFTTPSERDRIRSMFRGTSSGVKGQAAP
jgi:O-antigen/teichoic acid export membrane protein